MAIVSKPDRENKHTLYVVPDEVLAQYSIPADKLAQMFPKKEEHSREEAIAVATAAKSGGDEDHQPTTAPAYVARGSTASRSGHWTYTSVATGLISLQLSDAVSIRVKLST